MLRKLSTAWMPFILSVGMLCAFRVAPVRGQFPLIAAPTYVRPVPPEFKTISAYLKPLRFNAPALKPGEYKAFLSNRSILEPEEPRPEPPPRSLVKSYEFIIPATKPTPSPAPPLPSPAPVQTASPSPSPRVVTPAGLPIFSQDEFLLKIPAAPDPIAAAKVSEAIAVLKATTAPPPIEPPAALAKLAPAAPLPIVEVKPPSPPIVVIADRTPVKPPEIPSAPNPPIKDPEPVKVDDAMAKLRADGPPPSPIPRPIPNPIAKSERVADASRTDRPAVVVVAEDRRPPVSVRNPRIPANDEEQSNAPPVDLVPKVVPLSVTTTVPIDERVAKAVSSLRTGAEKVGSEARPLNPLGPPPTLSFADSTPSKRDSLRVAAPPLIERIERELPPAPTDIVVAQAVELPATLPPAIVATPASCAGCGRPAPSIFGGIHQPLIANQGDGVAGVASGCKTCGSSGCGGCGRSGCGSCGGDWNCAPGRRPCPPSQVQGPIGQFFRDFYECICCQDPCYEPHWLPQANAAIFVDGARPVTHTEIRWNGANNGVLPDRSEYLWARADGKGRGPRPPAGVLGERRFSYNDLILVTETAKGNVSAIIELPYRSMDPANYAHGAGFGDMVVGSKTLLLDCELLLVAFEFKTYIPVGNPLKGTGTGHLSLEPSLLLSLKLDRDTYFQGQIAEWIPLGGDPAYSGAILHTHFSLNHVVCRINPDVPLIATMEVQTWSFQDGLYTDPLTGIPVKSSGIAYVSAGPGLRLFMCDRLDLGVGVALSLTRENFARETYTTSFRVRY